MTTLPAHCVDMRYLTETLRTHCNNGTVTSRQQVERFLLDSVERVKSFSVHFRPQFPRELKVIFSTRDDGGWYDYSLSIMLAEGVALPDVPVLPI